VEINKENNGAWIFVSHSHYDLPNVRIIRNELEKLGHNPLLFFLKCMEDNVELPDLIKKEITARNWFVLCESEHSKKSTWVTEEVECIKSLPGKVFKTIYLDDDLIPQLEKLKSLSKRVTVFISSHQSDRDILKEIYNRFKEEDYRVFESSHDLDAGSDWQKAILSNLDEAIQHGFVLLLLSPDAIESSWMQSEIKYALKKALSNPKSNIVPIIIKDAEMVINLSIKLFPPLRVMQMADFTRGNLQEQLTILISHLKTREME
jgi:hypothetical protein